MIDWIRRALVAAITPPPVATTDEPGLVRVKSYTRRPAVNVRRDTLHAVMGLDLSAFRASRSIPTEGQSAGCSRVAS